MSRVWAVVVVCAALPVLGGYFGWVHPVGDSLAVFRLQGAAGLAVLSVLAFWGGVRRIAGAALMLAMVAGMPLGWMYLTPGPDGGTLRLYQKNMLFRNDDLAGLEADIRAASPDVLTLQEVSVPNKALLAGLADVLPYQLWCPFRAVGGPAVATRLQPVVGQTVCADGLAAIKVEGPDGPLWLVSVHLHWPWPYGQSAHVADLLTVLEEMEAPVVMAGDFNMVRWSDAMAALRGVAGVQHAGPVRGTYTGFAPWVVLPIDHVLSPGGGRMEVRPGLGADHLGLLADLSL